MKKTIESIEYDFGGDVFVDIGGNVGMWTTVLHELYDKVLFVEPSEIAISKAKQVINDRTGKVKYFKNICSDQVGTKKSIYTPVAESGTFSIYGKELYEDQGIVMSEEDIETITLDSLIPEIGDAKNILVKIDTEGSDLDILLGGKEFIRKYRPLLIVEFHFHMYFNQEKADQVLALLEEMNYDITEYKADGYRYSPNQIFDGKHNGTEMYDLHYHILAK
jgi:FkbM family methyltransferase